MVPPILPKREFPPPSTHKRRLRKYLVAASIGLWLGGAITLETQESFPARGQRQWDHVLVVKNQEKPATDKRIILAIVTFLTASGTYNKPADWNNSSNSIECLGAGAGGGSSNCAVHKLGGAGGGYGKQNNVTILATNVYAIGAGGVGATTPNVCSLSTEPTAGGNTTFTNSTAIGNGGNFAVGGTGVGDVTHTGGSAGAPAGFNSGGGGAAGSSGDGSNSPATSGGAGGAGGTPNGGTAGTSGGGAGGAGTTWDGTHGTGGGGGGKTGSGNGGAGGLYGAGGGASACGATGNVGGAGKAGLIIVTYTPGAAAAAYKGGLLLMGVGG